MADKVVFDKKNILVTGGAGFTPHHLMLMSCISSC